MKKNTLLYVILTFIYSAPVITFAFDPGVKGFLVAFRALINPTITVVVGLAIVFFFWGLAQFILHSGDQKTHEEGKNKMLWGIIAIFVMVSIWGIVAWIGGVFGISTSTTNSSTQTSSGFNGNLTPQQGGWTPPTF